MGFCADRCTKCVVSEALVDTLIIGLRVLDDDSTTAGDKLDMWADNRQVTTISLPAEPRSEV